MQVRILAIAVAGLVLGFTVPVQAAPSVQGQMTCKEAAKLKFPDSRSERHAFRKACKEASKGSPKTAEAATPTYAGDI
jgi:hypothetical protein